MSRRFSQKKNAKQPICETARNEYYESVSARLGIFQVILYLSLFAFVVLSFAKNTNLVTYQNFYYFFKDLGASAESVDVVGADTVSYPAADEQSFTLYRNGLAVAGNHAVTVFTATGRQTVSQSIHYKQPIAIGSGKYLLVYELGGTQYSLYNSYTQIYEGKSDFPIFGATISKEGMYALVSRSENYTSVVSLYSSHFSLLNRYNKNGYVMDVALNEKGTRLAILTSSVKDGLFATELTLHEPRKGDQGVSLSLGNCMALSCGFSASGGIQALCEDRICFVSSGGTLESEYRFEGMQLASSELCADGAAICLRPSAVSEENTVIVFDKNGKSLYYEALKERVKELRLYGNSLFLMTANGVSRLQLKNGSQSFLECNVEKKHILAVNQDEVLLCSGQRAEYLRLD
ncbi:MAG: hypothetical protein IKJ35_06285 [Clostridia bacterium]|nr:hypothetical protein [Clostridia bacterium]